MGIAPSQCAAKFKFHTEFTPDEIDRFVDRKFLYSTDYLGRTWKAVDVVDNFDGTLEVTMKVTNDPIPPLHPKRSSM